MKFGGTSVEDAQAMKRTAAIVRGRRERGLEAVVVVSAMAKVTDRCWLRLRRRAAGIRQELWRSGRGCGTGMSIRRRRLLSAEAICSRLQATLHQEFDALDDLLRGIAAVGELTPRTNDLVVSFGERLSSRMIAEAFEQRGLQGVHVDARSLHRDGRKLWQGCTAGACD